MVLCRAPVNAMSPTFFTELRDAFEQCDADAACRAVVFAQSTRHPSSENGGSRYRASTEPSPWPGIRWTAPSASCRPRAGSRMTSSTAQPAGRSFSNTSTTNSESGDAALPSPLISLFRALEATLKLNYLLVMKN